MADPETGNIGALRTECERYLQTALETGMHLRMHDDKTGYVAAETPDGLLIEQRPGILIVTGEGNVAAKSLVSRVFFSRSSRFAPEVYESTVSDEGWGKRVVLARQTDVVAHLQALLPRAS